MVNRVALVTGATRGIGKAIALKLAENGINLVLTGRSQDNLEDVASQAEEKGVNTYTYKADLEDDLMPQRLIKETLFEYKRLDYLINNAGFALQATIEETTNEQWDKIMNINAKAPFLLCKEAIPQLKMSKHGTIINISSVVGHKGYINQAAYTASKHALTGFTKVLAKELQPYGIRVHLISPGGVYTDMVKEMRPELLSRNWSKSICQQLFLRMISG